MAKLDLSKKALKKKVLLCILYHNKRINLKKLLNKIQLNFVGRILIINDGIDYHFKRKNFKQIRFITRPKQKYSISINRNVALKYAKKEKFEILLFLDSDIIPQKNLVRNHLRSHARNTSLFVVGGPVLPSANFKNMNFWEFLDGRLSWFTSIDHNTSHYVDWPYHLPTCNLSIRVKEFFEKKIRFNEKIETGEEYDVLLLVFSGI